MGNKPKQSDLETLPELIDELRALIRAARQAVSRSVDTIQVLTNFEIGRRIVEYEQQGAPRAEYGKRLLKKLSAELNTEFGRGFSHRNLDYMRKFYLLYKDRALEISQMESAKFPVDRKSQMLSGILTKQEKSQTPSGKFGSLQIWQKASAKFVSPFKLSWSQYVFLISIDNQEERRFYEIEAASNGWSLPELRRQYQSRLYERLALSRDKEGVRKLAAEEEAQA